MRDEAEKRIGHLYPKVEVTAEMAKERPDLKPYVGPQAHRDRLALGAHGEEPEPGLRASGRAARLDLHALHQGGQGGLCRAGDRGRRLPLHGEGGEAEGCGSGEERHQAGARRELPVPDVGDADRRRLHQGRGQGRAHGRAADGDRGRGRSRAGLSRADAGARGGSARGEAGVEAGCHDLPEQTRSDFDAALRLDDVAATSSPPASSWR